MPAPADTFQDPSRRSAESVSLESEPFHSKKHTKKSGKRQRSFWEDGDGPSPENFPDILEFASEKYFCNEEEGAVELKVMRLGAGTGTCRVKWTTKEGSAQAGVKFVDASGVLEFRPFERQKKIFVQLLGDEAFDSTLEFSCLLSDPENAVLGMYLYRTEVFIADDDAFPTNLFRSSINEGKYHEVPHWLLFIEYIRMHLRDTKFRWAFILNMLMDQIANLQMVWQILLVNYLIDNVLRPADGSDPPDKTEAFWTVLTVVAISILPHALLLRMDLSKVNKRIAGMATIKLQENLMRKFLSYNDQSRAAVSTSDLTMAITRDVPELVQQGLLKVFPVLQKVGLLICYGSLAIKSSPYPWIMVLNFFMFPLMMLGFLRLRQAGTARRQHHFFNCQTGIVSCVQVIIDYYRLVEDYFQKQEMVTRFRGRVRMCNEAFTRALQWTIVNEHFAPFLTDLFCGIFILLAYRDTLANQYGIGEFVTGIGVWRGIGTCYQKIYDDMLVVQHSVAPLHNVVHYMNLPTDTQDRMVVSRTLLKDLDIAQAVAHAILAGEKHEPCPFVQSSCMVQCGDMQVKAVYAQDLAMISCEKLVFAYPDCPPILRGASFDISQGKLVGFIGGRGSGKSTLLQLLSNVLVPDQASGLMFVPPHLRVLHVTHSPIIIHDMGLLENLCFGPSDGEDENPERVRRICERMGMSAEALRGLDDVYPEETTGLTTTKHSSVGSAEVRNAAEHESKAFAALQNTQMAGTAVSMASRVGAEMKFTNSTLLSHSDRCLIHIARAFVMNPEVLVIHKPLTHFDDLQAGRVVELLREFVDMRGVEKTNEERKLSRPHTCIFSSAALEGIEKADAVFQISDGTVSEVDIEFLMELLKKAKQMFKVLDVDGDGVVTKDEFMQRLVLLPESWETFSIDQSGLAAMSPGRRKVEIMSLLGKAFDEIDHEGGGEINVEEVVHYLRAKVHSNVPTKDRNTRVSSMGPELESLRDGWSESIVPTEDCLPQARIAQKGLSHDEAIAQKV